MSSEATPHAPADSAPGRSARADRIAVLIDADAYFEAVAAAFEQAERSILIWDFAPLYAFERESLPSLRVGPRLPDRVHLELDGNHPFSASHHQKIVVVDDAVAFVGGIDLTSSRWDSRSHDPDEPLRIDPWGSAYPPFHDIQMAVDGAAAAALGDVARDRWRRATGRRLPRSQVAGDPWPAELSVALSDLDVRITRTDPRIGSRGRSVREVEASLLSTIRAAGTLLYVENQYLTSETIADALVESLRRPEGPEVVLILPQTCSGWLEQASMGMLRTRILARLRDADAHARLHVYAPWADTARGVSINVHAKLMIADDRRLIVGSANLSNRSMGLDSECNVSLDAGEDAGARAAIRSLRHDLLAEHLGCAPERVSSAEAQSQSLAAAIERLAEEPRTLCPIEGEPEQSLAEVIPAAPIFDPARPLDSEVAVRAFVTDLASEFEVPSGRRLARIGAGIAILGGLAALWRLTPVGEWLEAERLAGVAQALRASTAATVLAVPVFAAASLALAPVTGLIVACGIVFGPWTGSLVAVAGALASATIAFSAARRWGRSTLRRLGNRRLHAVSRALARRGVWAMAGIRLVPIAPFTIVNAAAGLSELRLRDFLAGTSIGMLPGILALCFAASGAEATIRDVDPITLAGTIAAVLLALVGLPAIGRRLLGEDQTEEETETEETG